MDDEYSVQLGLFGAATVVDGMHRVQAHLRLLPEGGTTFVAEHWRWNRGRTAAPPSPKSGSGRRRPAEPPAADQLTLWSRSG